MTTKLQASPGILIAEEIQEDNKTSIKLTGENQSRLMRGKVIAVGIDVESSLRPFKGKDFASVGEIIVFLSYEGGYDYRLIDNKKYYFIKFEDVRGIDK